jgi:hypothetical protein
VTTPLAELIASLRPVLHPGVYVFCAAPEGTSLAGVEVLATFREAEGTTLVLEERVARELGLDVQFRAAWITLSVNSDLAGVGLTAAFSRALADAGIACNIMAAIHHDHLFVPWERGPEALRVLEGLARGR